MMQARMNNSADRAKEIAIRVLAGGYDPLLACRDLSHLRGQLSGVTDGVMDTFIGVASEVDDLPIGAEREHWAAEVLRLKDIEAADYRARVKDTVARALQELLVALGEANRGI